MDSNDKTGIGGPQEEFGQTQWTEIRGARTLDPDRRRRAVGKVMSRYWRPVYAYLRRKGMGNEEAKDLTQGFFTEVVLGRELIQKADRTKGRFRTFLLTALDRFVTSDYRRGSTATRQPEGGVLALDGMEDELLIPAKTPQPDEAFAYAWALQLLNEVLEAVEAASRQAGQETHWEVFRRTVAEPQLLGSDPPTLAGLCEELEIESQRTASNMNVTVKRRFRSILRTKVRESVESDDEVDAEIRDLMQILSQGRAGTQGIPRI